jgi:hypothetical protein
MLERMLKTVRVLLIAVPALLLYRASEAAGPVTAEVWDAPALSVPAAQLLQSATAIKRERPADIVVLLDERIFVFDDADRLTRTSHMIYRVDSPNGVEGWASSSAEWQPWHQAKPDIRARVISVDGGEHLIDPKLLTDAGTQEGGNQVFDDDHVLQGPLPAVEVGAVVEENITISDEKPFFSAGTAYREYIGRPVPVIHTRIVIDAPESKPIKRLVHLLPNSRVTETRANGRVRWVLDQGVIDEKSATESNLPPDEPSWANVEFSTGSSWESLATSYREQTEPRIRNDDAKPLLAGLKPPGLSSARNDFIGKVVERLHGQVRYTGVEFGSAKLIPEFPSETLRRKFGDCKDKSTLLVTALRASGIEAYLALLSAGDDQDVSPELPGMGMFDHAIVFVPAPIPGEQDLWIDATAEYARVGTLPGADTGRLALIVRPGEKSLTRTPDLRSADNAQVETREFYLSEYGPARVVETTETRGIIELEYRSWYAGADTKERRQSLEDYVKSAYRAKALTRYEHTSSLDFSKLYSLKLEMKDAPVGSTDLSAAAVGVNVYNLTSRLPSYFTQDADDKEEDEGEKPKEPRTADVVFEPFVSEWRYRIQPPDGFKVREVPKGAVTNLGPAKLTSEFSVAPDGMLLASWRFDSVKGRYSIAEADALTSSLKELKTTGPMLISFDHPGAALRAAGDFKGSLQSYESIALRNPQLAVNHVRYAYALLEAGLGARAQREAMAATKADPKNAQAWKAQGWMLQHDAVGRRFGAGFDRAGAIAAYRKARDLDPKNTDISADLAVLYEHDARGIRYADPAGLNLAITEYQARARILAADKSSGTDQFADNLSYALLFAHRYAEVRDAVKPQRQNDTRRALSIAATGATEGSAKAIEASRDAGIGEKDGRKALVGAAGLLVNLREYAIAADLLEASARGQTTTAAITQRIAVLRKTTPVDRKALTVTDPRSAVLHMFAVLMSPEQKPEVFRSIMSRRSGDSVNDDDGYKLAQRMLLSSLSRSDAPLDVTADLMFSNLRLNIEGDDTHGYRAQMRVGPVTQNFYVLNEGGSFRILAITGAIAPLATLAIERLDAGDLPGARRWLDWAKLELSVVNSEDPLAGYPFARAWLVGTEYDAATTRAAAAMLLADFGMNETALPLLLTARTASQNPAEQVNLDLALASAYLDMEQWQPLSDVATRLLTGSPGSALAFRHQQWARLQLKQYPEVDAAAHERLARKPEDSAALKALTQAAEVRGSYAEIPDILQPLIDSGHATSSDYNDYAWSSLLIRPVSDKAVEIARQAFEETQGRSFAIAHTLACVYAATGKPREARDLLLKGMTQIGLVEPDDSSWYGFGLIAEAYGDTQSARDYYARVAKPRKREILSSGLYAMSQARLSALK